MKKSITEKDKMLNGICLAKFGVIRFQTITYIENHNLRFSSGTFNSVKYFSLWVMCFMMWPAYSVALEFKVCWSITCVLIQCVCYTTAYRDYTYVTGFWKISPNVTFYNSYIYNQNEEWELPINLTVVTICGSHLELPENNWKYLKFSVILLLLLQ